MVHSAIAQALDWFAIKAGCWSVRFADDRMEANHRVALIPSQPDFLPHFIPVPNDLEFQSPVHFRFRSAVTTLWPQNNTVFGTFFRCHERWTDFPVVILLHGWNAMLCYRHLFPWLAKRLQRLGVSTLAFELPYHGHRQPHRDGVPVNFISPDLMQMLQATQQAVSDVRSLVAWLEAQGCRSVGMWGFSLGAWLAGLAASVEPRSRFSVFFTPIARLDRVINELDFCAPIRQSLNKTRMDLTSLNLAGRQPLLPADRMLVVLSEHDLFAPPETVEELWRSWGQPELWRVRQGHISVLLSFRTLDRVAHWIAQKSRAQAPLSFNASPASRECI